MTADREPSALHAAVADLARALAGRPAARAPRQRVSEPPRGLVIDPGQGDLPARR
ncbi:hypothetical protein ACWDKQ_34560 [Saccharopolyspora sp. NPDC000995]